MREFPEALKHRDPLHATDVEKYDWAMSIAPENVWMDGEVGRDEAFREGIRMFDRIHRVAELREENDRALDEEARDIF